MGIHRIYEALFRGFRRRRMRAFAETFRPHAGTAILDVGGTPLNWSLLGCDSDLTLLNLELPEGFESLPGNYSFVVGDAVDLEFEDGAFDIAFSITPAGTSGQAVYLPCKAYAGEKTRGQKL